jgi:hypothetical protein
LYPLFLNVFRKSKIEFEFCQAAAEKPEDPKLPVTIILFVILRIAREQKPIRPGDVLADPAKDIKDFLLMVVAEAIDSENWVEGSHLQEHIFQPWN